MCKISKLFFLFILASFTLKAQLITITGGPGKIDESTVILGEPFSAAVTELDGTPSQWAVGIGTINGQTIFSTTSSTVSNAIVSRAIDQDVAIISVGASNGKGVVKYLTVVDQSCNLELQSLVGGDRAGVFVSGNNVDLYTYSWSISPSVPFTNNGSSIFFTGNPNGRYRVTVNISGSGGCDGTTLTEGVILEDVIFYSIVSPNPSSTGSFSIENSEEFELTVLNDRGEKVSGYSLANTEKGSQISNLASGSYILKISYANGTSETKKIVVK